MSTADSIRGNLFKNSGILGIGALVVGGAAMVFGAPIVAGIAGIAGLGAAAGIIGSSVLPDKALTSIAGIAQTLAGAAKHVLSGFDKMAQQRPENAATPASRRPEQVWSPEAMTDFQRLYAGRSFVEDPKFKGGAVDMPTVTGDNFTPGPPLRSTGPVANNISVAPVTRPFPTLTR